MISGLKMVGPWTNQMIPALARAGTAASWFLDTAALDADGSTADKDRSGAAVVEMLLSSAASTDSFAVSWSALLLLTESSFLLRA